METVHFSIEGEFIANFAKNSVLEGEWERGLRVLTEGNESQYGLAIKILEGEYTLTGVDSDIHCEKFNDIKYKEEVEQMLSGVMFINNEWYKVYAKVNTITEKNHERALIYMDNPVEDKSFFDKKMYLLKKTKTPPIWLHKQLKERKTFNLENVYAKEYGIDNLFFGDTSQTEIVMNMIKYNRLTISDNSMYEEIEARENLVKKLLLKEYKEKILSKSKDYIQVKHLKIPKEPFLEWLRTSDPRIAYENTGLKETFEKNSWSPICPRGMKMLMDNRYHNDWIVGAGLDPETFYESKDNELIYNYLNCLYFMNKLFIKLHGQGVIKGKIGTPDNYDSESIVIVKNASVEYFELAKKVKAVVCEVGGPAAHLAINAEEYNLNVCVIPKASELFKDHEYIMLDFNYGVYELFKNKHYLLDIMDKENEE